MKEISEKVAGQISAAIGSERGFVGGLHSFPIAALIKAEGRWSPIALL